MIKFTPKKLRRIVPIFGTIFVITGTYLAIQFGKGYRPTTEGLSGTGLLAANSFPDGAEVYLDDKLATATDDTINLPPSKYAVTIKKEGYIPWNKTLTINQELVTQTNASLFLSVPSLSPLTITGATNQNPSPDGQKIAYVVASSSAVLKNGLYTLELQDSNLPGQNSPKQIANSSTGLDFTLADFLWSPDSSQIIAHFPEENSKNSSNYLIDTANNQTLETLPDVTARLSLILAEWEEQIAIEETRQLNLLPIAMQDIATQSATNVYLSPNQEMVMYTATSSAIIPDNIIQQPLSTNSQPESRSLVYGNLYIYDMKEDKNFLIDEDILEDDNLSKGLLLLSTYQQSIISAATPSAVITPNTNITYNKLWVEDSIPETFSGFRSHYSPIYTQNFQWYPDSKHLLITLPGKIDVIEYDSTNWITVYSGPFESDFTYPWPDGNKTIILTNLNPSSNLPTNLYSIDIK